MPSLLTRLFPNQNNAPVPKVSIIGLDCAGKRTLLHKLACSEVTTEIPTIGMSIDSATIQVPGCPTAGSKTAGSKKQRYVVRVTDVGGCSKITRAFVRRLMVEEDTAAIVWVVDLSDTDRYVESEEELRRFVEGVGKGCTSGKAGAEDAALAKEVPVLVLANKIDIPNKHSIDILRPKIGDLLSGRRFEYINTCLTAPLPHSGILGAFAWLADEIAAVKEEQHQLHNNKYTPKTEVKMKGELAASVANDIANLRSPATLAAKLEEWMARAEGDVSAEEFLRKFEAMESENWDHYTHLRLAYVILLKYGRREGKSKIFTSFSTFLSLSPLTLGKTLHTSMTYFWIQMVHMGILATFPDLDSHTLQPLFSSDAASDVVGGGEKQASEKEEDRLDQFATFLRRNRDLVDAHLWTQYYSKEKMMSKEAREGFVLPNLKGLPDTVGVSVSGGEREKDKGIEELKEVVIVSTKEVSV